MKDKKNRRREKFLNSPFQKKMLLLIFIAAIVPSGIVTICLYYIIFNLLAAQLGIPEAIAYNLLPVARKVNIIILTTLPISLIIIWGIAVELSHRIAGPIFRLEKELDRVISGEQKTPLVLRKKDELKPLTEKINKIISKK